MRWMYTVKTLARREGGQDLVEYALLAGVIAIAGVLVFPDILDRLDDIFSAREDAIYDIWEPPVPAEPPPAP